jgi:hypothetical protein
MKHKGKKRWHQSTLRMKDNHTWKAPDGYKIVVIDRGAVSFNVPDGWLVAQLEPFEMHDAPPPDDNARLMVSFWRTPPGIDWTELPLKQLFIQSTEGSKHEILSRSEIIKMARTDLEIVWNEHRFMDPVEHREAYSWIALARGWDIHVLITLDLWVTDAEKLQPTWDEVLRSLQLGRYIEDPTKGPLLH